MPGIIPGMKPENLEAIGANGTKLSILGAGTASAGYFSASEFAAIVGALVAIAGLVITWYYKREAIRLRRLDDERRSREHEMRMRLMTITQMPVAAPVCDTDLSPLGDAE